MTALEFKLFSHSQNCVSDEIKKISQDNSLFLEKILSAGTRGYQKVKKELREAKSQADIDAFNLMMGKFRRIYIKAKREKDSQRNHTSESEDNF